MQTNVEFLENRTFFGKKHFFLKKNKDETQKVFDNAPKHQEHFFYQVA